MPIQVFSWNNYLFISHVSLWLPSLGLKLFQWQGTHYSARQHIPLIFKQFLIVRENVPTYNFNLGRIIFTRIREYPLFHRSTDLNLLSLQLVYFSKQASHFLWYFPTFLCILFLLLSKHFTWPMLSSKVSIQSWKRAANIGHFRI